MIILIKPIKKIRFVKEIRDLRYHDPLARESNENQSIKELMIVETLKKSSKKKNYPSVLLLKEKGNYMSKTFHICD